MRLSNATLMKYDAGGNLVSVRDPNGVGWDAGATIGTYTGYNGLNRLTNRIDTQGDRARRATTSTATSPAPPTPRAT